MAIELDSITSGYSTEKINNNFQKLEEEINNNLLRRDGLGVGEGNQMENPLDMNSFDIINVNNIDAQGFSIKGQSIDGYVEGAKEAAIAAAQSEANALVSENNASDHADYAEAQAARAEAAAASSDAEVLRADLADGVTAGKGAELVAYDETNTVSDKIAEVDQFAADIAAGTGALLVGYRSTNVYDKLTKLAISPQDFGAVADGVNNDQAAFEQAAGIGVPVFLPAGEYNVPTGDFSGQKFYSFSGASVNNSTVSVTDVTANAFPVGAVMSFTCTPENLPSGFIPLDGSLLNREVYPALWTFANGSGNIVADASWASSKMAFSTGNGTSTFRVPDARGLTQAAADNGALVDTDFVLGDVVERVVTDGTEPATTTFRYGVQTVAIRAFSGSVNPGLIDITALAAQVNTIQTDIVDVPAGLVALEDKVIGIGQTYVDVSGSRVANTAYQNTTGRPIYVSVRTANGSKTIKMQVSVNGSTWVDVDSSTGLGGNIYMDAIVPIDQYYQVTTSFIKWVELR